MTTIYSSNNKTFLTDVPEEDGAVVWYTEASHWVKDGDKKLVHLLEEEMASEDSDPEDRSSVDASLSLHDCSRKITLDFSVYSFSDNAEEIVIKKLAKIDRLAEELRYFRSSLAMSYEFMLEARGKE